MVRQPVVDQYSLILTDECYIMSGFFLQFGHFFLINNYSNYDIYKIKPVLRGHLWDKEKVV